MTKTSKNQSLVPTFEFDTIITEDAQTVIRRAQAWWDAEETKHNEALYMMLSVVLYVRRLCEEPANWQEVCNHPYWKQRRERDRPKISMKAEDKSRFVTLLMMAGPEQVRYDRAYKYGRVIHHYFKQNVEPETLKGKIKADHGIEKVLTKLNEREPLRAIDNDDEPSEAKAKKRTDEETLDDDENDEEDGTKEPEDNDKSVDEGSGKPIRLGIDVTYKEFMKAMKVKIGSKVRITVVREESAGAWVSFRALRLKF